MKQKEHSFDPKCLDLAIYFYPAASAERLNELAQQIQDVVESDDLDVPEISSHAGRDESAQVDYLTRLGCTCPFREGVVGNHRPECPYRQQNSSRCVHGQETWQRCGDCESAGEFFIPAQETRPAPCCDINASYPGKHRSGCPGEETRADRPTEYSALAGSHPAVCKHCGEPWVEHLHTDEASSCPTANR
jgi:hypothetical protein